MRDVLGNHSILILKFPYSSQFGGGERHTLLLAEYLREMGWQVWCVTSCRVLLEKFREKKMPVRRVFIGKEPVTILTLLIFPIIAIYAFFYLSLVLLWYRFRHGVKAVYCLSLTEKVLITPFARLLGMRVYWMEHVNLGDWIKKSPLRFFYRLWARYAMIIAVSQSVANDIIALGVSRKFISVVHKGIDEREAERVPKERIMRFSKQFTVGTVTRLHPEKGIEYLLKSVAIARETVPQIRLVIIGEGPERHRLEWLARKLEISSNVHFTGYIKDPYPWLLGMDVFVLPSSERESSGFVLTQAMSCWLPCIGTTLGGIPELIHEGENGYLVPPGDARAIADRIEYLYFNPNVRLSMGKAGRERVRQEFTQERMLRELMRLLFGGDTI